MLYIYKNGLILDGIYDKIVTNNFYLRWIMSLNIFSFKKPKDVKALLPKRQSDFNKGDCGRVLCVCGSSGMAGAAYLCVKAAYRSGAGLVEIFTHESNRTILQTLIPEAIVTTYGDEYAKSDILPSLERADCIVAGCGLGTSTLAREVISDLLREINTEEKPLILDADALNIISRIPVLLKYAKGAIITPHVKEMARLTGKDVADILESPVFTAHEFAKSNALTCVLKSHITIVSDGSDKAYVNTTGNSGMATGGSGDVLAGILAGIIVQKRKDNDKDTLTDASLCVYLHGLCGDIAAKSLTGYSLMASDIIDALPVAFGKLI